MLHRLPSSVELDDLISVGTIGLLHAIDRFDPGRGISFETFAEFRIKGAMLDELRSYDFLSRGTRIKAKRVSACREELRQRLGREPKQKELAEACEMGEKEVESLLLQKEQAQFLTLDDLGQVSAESREETWELLARGQSEDPFAHTLLGELRGSLAEALEALPERNRFVMALYYQEGLNFKEIGRVLERTESRISQIHSDSVRRLKKRLKRP